SEPWPEDVCLYQPYKLQQVLLPDNAQCLAVQCYLQMCGLPFRTVLRTNAEHMSPSGKPPFLRAGPYVISEVEPIIKFVSTKGHSLSDKLDKPQQAEMKAYLALVQGTLGNAEPLVFCHCCHLPVVLQSSTNKTAVQARLDPASFRGMFSLGFSRSVERSPGKTSQQQLTGLSFYKCRESGGMLSTSKRVLLGHYCN
ncbi:Metaxin-2, partial [Branchiostoma belcheri]